MNAIITSDSLNPENVGMMVEVRYHSHCYIQGEGNVALYSTNPVMRGQTGLPIFYMRHHLRMFDSAEIDSGV